MSVARRRLFWHRHRRLRDGGVRNADWVPPGSTRPVASHGPVRLDVAPDSSITAATRLATLAGLAPRRPDTARNVKYSVAAGLMPSRRRTRPASRCARRWRPAARPDHPCPRRAPGRGVRDIGRTGSRRMERLAPTDPPRRRTASTCRGGGSRSPSGVFVPDVQKVTLSKSRLFKGYRTTPVTGAEPRAWAVTLADPGNGCRNG